MYITRNLFNQFTSYVFYFLFQDVMLSATTTQSPLATQSSVFTIPSVSMGTGGINLTDHLFLPSMSALDPTHGTADTKSDHNGRLCVSCYVFYVQITGKIILKQKSDSCPSSLLSQLQPVSLILGVYFKEYKTISQTERSSH